MIENNHLTVPTLSVKMTGQKLPVRQKIARIAALLLAGAIPVLWLREPRNDVQLAYNVYFNIDWMGVFLHTLFASALLFSASCLICELTGYAKRKFFVLSAAICVLLAVASAWWRYQFILSDDTFLDCLPNKACLWLIAFAVVFLLGKFVLFKKPREEQEE